MPHPLTKISRDAEFDSDWREEKHLTYWEEFIHVLCVLRSLFVQNCLENMWVLLNVPENFKS